GVSFARQLEERGFRVVRDRLANECNRLFDVERLLVGSRRACGRFWFGAATASLFLRAFHGCFSRKVRAIPISERSTRDPWCRSGTPWYASRRLKGSATRNRGSRTKREAGVIPAQGRCCVRPGLRGTCHCRFPTGRRQKFARSRKPEDLPIGQSSFGPPDRV